MPKAIDEAVKDVILSLLEFNEKEKHNNGPVIPFENVMARTAAMIGVSVRTISRIKARGKTFIPIGSVPSSSTGELEEQIPVQFLQNAKMPGKGNLKRIKPIKIVEREGADDAVIRRRAQEYYSTSSSPSLRMLHQALQREIKYKGTYDALRKTLVKMGFDFKRNKWVDDYVPTKPITIGAMKTESADISLADLKRSMKTQPQAQTMCYNPSKPLVIKQFDVPVDADWNEESLSENSDCEEGEIIPLAQPVNIEIEMDNNWRDDVFTQE